MTHDNQRYLLTANVPLWSEESTLHDFTKLGIKFVNLKTGGSNPKLKIKWGEFYDFAKKKKIVSGINFKLQYDFVSVSTQKIKKYHWEKVILLHWKYKSYLFFIFQ